MKPADAAAPHLLLAGFKGCGKSTVGARAADRIGSVFLDLDAVIEELYASDGAWVPFRTIFHDLGPEGFRALEEKAAREAARRAALSAAAGRPLLLALGGGALLQESTRSILRAFGQVVHLRVPCEVVLARARRDGFPAFVQAAADPEAELAALYERREPLYALYADLVVDLEALAPEAAAERLAAAIRRRWPGFAPAGA